MSDLVRLSMSIEKSLYEKLEALVAQSRYTNRSEFLRDMIREHLVEREWESQKELLGTISMVYDHHQRGLSERLTGLQHDFRGTILATTHIHLDHHHCAEMIMVRGRGEDIQRLVDDLHRQRGVLHAKLATSSTGKTLS
ncbi:MAG: nickel-responsive transcriptional regulator NikR [Phycisphaerae bacterium]|nr:nickel-responsive transcriptional regulator NikR [Phycisphaerae bacterium]